MTTFPEEKIGKVKSLNHRLQINESISLWEVASQLDVDKTSTILKKKLKQKDELLRELRLRSESQSYDPQKKIFVAEGNASALINGYVLKADRFEFDEGFKTLNASGKVRFHKGNQYLQSSSLSYNLSKREGGQM